MNMRRFDEERRKFEMEKLRFLEEKRQLDKIRLLRFEKYRQGAFTEPKNEPIKGPTDYRYDRARMDNLNMQRNPPDPGQSSTDQSSRRGPSLKDRKRRSRTRREEDESSQIESSSEEVEKVRHRARSILTQKEQKPKMVEKLPDLHVEPKVVEQIEEPIEIKPEEELPKKTEEIVDKPEQADTPQEEIARTDETPKPSPPPTPKIEEEPKPSILSRFFGIFKGSPKPEEEKKVETKTENSSKEDTSKADENPNPEKTVAEKEEDNKLTKMKIIKLAYREIRDNWAPFKLQHKDNVIEIRQSLNKCFVDLVLLCILCGMGGLVFRALEGNYEHSYKCGVRKVKRDFIDQLWLSSHNMRYAVICNRFYEHKNVL
jgi:potassium channel subfamily K member 18